MASNLAFNTQGATPSDMLNTYRSNNPAVGAGTPQAIALSRAQGGFNPGPTSFMTSQSIPGSTPSTPLKKTTVNAPDGSSVTHEYHAPAAPGSPDAAAKQQAADMQTYFPGMINTGSTTSSGGTTPASSTTSATTPASTTASSTTPATTTTTPYNTAVSGLINTGTQSSDDVNNAQNALKNFQIANANTEAAIAGDPNYSLDTKTGIGALVANRVAQELPAYQTAVSNALQSQGQKITALGNAGTLSTPSQTQTALSPSQTLYSTTGPNAGTPIAGLNAGGASGNAYQNAITTAANAVKNGMSYATALSGLSSFGVPTASTDLLKALGPGFNVNANEGSAAAQQSNVQTGGTAVTNANAQGLGAAIQNYSNLNTAVQSAANLGQSLTSILAKGGVNTSDSTDLNSVVNTLAPRLGDTAFTNFVTALNDTRNAYQSIFTSAGQTTPTAADQSLLDALSPNSTVGQIVGALNTLNENAYSGRLEPAFQQVTSYHNALTGNSAGSAPTAPPTSGSTSGGNTYTITQTQ